MTPEQIEKKFKELEKKICCQLANTGDGENFANANLTFTDNRTHDLAGFDLVLSNGTVTIDDLGGSGTGIVGVDNTGLLVFTTAGANTALSNLAAVAINTSLISDTNNTDDLGSAAISWKDIYSRTLKLDGSTSGTITIEADSLSNSIRGTTLSGIGYVPATMISIVAAGDFTMQNINTVQPVFATGGDVWTLQASTSYYFEGFYYFTHGSTSHNIGMSFELGGGASVTSIMYNTLCWTTGANTQTSGQATTTVIVATNIAIVAAAAVAAESIRFSGIIRMNAGGTVTPSITFSADPTGTILSKANSYITFTPIGTNTLTTLGTVA